MFSLKQLHQIISRGLHLKAMALLQLMIMLSLAVPACCYEVDPGHLESGSGLTAGAADRGQDECPCCPDEQDTSSSDCSTCLYCSCYAPLSQTVSTGYAPSTTALISLERSTKLPEVDVPIFVPPQNLV